METATALTIESALAVLADARDRCEKEDMRTSAVAAALDFLAAHAEIQWPFENFRRALEFRPHDTYSSRTGRWQNVNASFNGIRRQFATRLA